MARAYDSAVVKLRVAWRGLGALPAFPVLLGLFSLIGLHAVTGGPVRVVVVVVSAGYVVLFILYCTARPTAGWDVFGTAVLPGFAAKLLHDIVGAPPWLGFVLVPASLWLAWDEDQPNNGDDDPDPAPDQPSASKMTSSAGLSSRSPL